LKSRPNLYQTHGLGSTSHILSVGLFVVAVALGGVTTLMGNEVLLLGAYVVGATLAAIAWYRNFRWKQMLWAVGMMLAALSTAAMALTGQYWLTAGAFVVLLSVLIYPPIAKQTHEEVRKKREQNRQ
jgi:hypothetical protein